MSSTSLPTALPALGSGSMLNIHHLELFYYVATHGGISKAVRKIPYGIQQPAVSGQMSLLEESVGTKLFERTPFRLTPTGEQLYAHIAPFFNTLPGLEDKLRAQACPSLRIGAAEMALKHYIPGIVAWLRKREPRLRLSLRSGYQAQLEQAVDEGSIDFAITSLDSKPGKRIRSLSLIQFPLMLSVHKSSPLRSAEEVLSSDPITAPLICMPESESSTRIFRRMLMRRKLNWPTAIEASTLEAVTTYVASGYGIGLTADIPRVALHPDVRLLPLDCPEQLETVALWAGEPMPLVQELITQLPVWIKQGGQQARQAEAPANEATPTKAKKRLPKG